MKHLHIGILGSGLMGAKLGTAFARLGHEVVFSYARTPGKLERLARQAGGRSRAGTPAEAARGADLVLLAVQWSRMDDVLRKAGSLSGKIVVTCSLPMSQDDSRLVVGLTTSGAETVARKLRKARVVSAFTTMPSEVLFPVFERRGKMPPPDLVFCGDDGRAKKTVARLIRGAGFHPVDLGGLEAARLIEPFTLVIANVAYRLRTNGRLAYRFERPRARR